MGEFFREEGKRESKKEERLIEDPQELFAAFNILTHKIQMMTNEGYETIMPLRGELLGTKQTPDDTGQIGQLRRRIDSSRISRMDIGAIMWSALKNIEDLDRWSERYIKYLEDYLDALQHVCRSSFRIISNLHTTINKLHNRVNELQSVVLPASRAAQNNERYFPPKKNDYKNVYPKEDITVKNPPLPYKDTFPPKEYSPATSLAEESLDEGMEASTSDIALPPEAAIAFKEVQQPEFDVVPLPKEIRVPKLNYPPAERPQMDVFNELIDNKIEMYREARKSADEKQIKEATVHLYAICGKDKSLRKKVEHLIARLSLEG